MVRGFCKSDPPEAAARTRRHSPELLPRQAHELAQAQLIPPPGGYAEIDDKKDRLPGEEVVIDKVQRDPEQNAPFYRR